MRSFFNTFFITLLLSAALYAQGKTVLIEVFTNSHCPLCPPAHEAVEDFFTNDPNAENAEVIFYHMEYPYPDDPLYQQSSIYSDQRDSFYGSFFFTPIGFIDGDRQIGSNYSAWENVIDSLVMEPQSFSISLDGDISGATISIDATVEKLIGVEESDLVIFIVAAEDVEYTGRNGIAHHPNVMRAIDNADGYPVNIDVGESTEINSSFTIGEFWNITNMNFKVFVQSLSTKKVYQVNSISYDELIATSLDDNDTVAEKFSLNQNYPNPFNPTTTIEFTIPTVGTSRDLSLRTKLVIYDLLGREIKTLLNKPMQPGKHSVEFNAEDLPSGLYIYQIKTGTINASKKMILIK
ncbi:MAG: T9SS type A sorting domain-containing protein [Melioribacteraceae bacterium]|nr:T9SS type A sorting domain-containing protein [Melioribacteraceae bacterium]MCF8356197.1 T9SS type A sorting domain-containing protein [Melioribacteraceae bacterium]MCF8394695.1 T9SS type A sorting domain-containing protein [Melioribacteraceae bacterium]MCF8420227.1 T9SS type A sorting domain-containing protein [Melioribacteraceae bacterium]